MAAAAVQVRSQDGWGRSLCIGEAPMVRDTQGMPSSFQTVFAFSFKRLNIAAELLHVPSIKTKFRVLSLSVCAVEPTSVLPPSLVCILDPLKIHDQGYPGLTL